MTMYRGYWIGPDRDYPGKLVWKVARPGPDLVNVANTLEEARRQIDAFIGDVEITVTVAEILASEWGPQARTMMGMGVPERQILQLFGPQLMAAEAAAPVAFIEEPGKPMVITPIGEVVTAEEERARRAAVEEALRVERERAAAAVAEAAAVKVAEPVVPPPVAAAITMTPEEQRIAAAYQQMAETRIETIVEEREAMREAAGVSPAEELRKMGVVRKGPPVVVEPFGMAAMRVTDPAEVARLKAAYEEMAETRILTIVEEREAFREAAGVPPAAELREMGVVRPGAPVDIYGTPILPVEEPVMVDGVVMMPAEARRRGMFPLFGYLAFGALLSFGLTVAKSRR